MNWRQLAKRLRAEGRFEDARKLYRRVADATHDDAAEQLGPSMPTKPVDSEDLMGDLSWRLKRVGTPEADDLAEDAEELGAIFGNDAVEDDEEDRDE